MLNLILTVLISTTYTAKELHAKYAFLAVPNLLKVELTAKENESSMKIFRTIAGNMGYRDTLVKEISLSEDDFMRIASFLEMPDKNNPLLTVFDNGKPIFRKTVQTYLGHVNKIGYGYTFGLIFTPLLPGIGTAGGVLIGTKMGKRKDFELAINRYMHHIPLDVGDVMGIKTSLFGEGMYGYHFKKKGDTTNIKGRIGYGGGVEFRVFYPQFYSHGINVEYFKTKAFEERPNGDSIGYCNMNGIVANITNRFRIVKRDMFELGAILEAGGGYATKEENGVSERKMVISTKGGVTFSYVLRYGSGLELTASAFVASYGKPAFFGMPMEFGYQGGGLKAGVSYIF